jgi:CRP/FNR family transcriptional regulator
VNPPLLELSETDLQELRRHALAKSFGKGEAVFLEGDDPDAIWLVEDGLIHSTIQGADGSVSIPQFYVKGQVFCAAAVITGKPYPCAAVAAQDSRLLAIPGRRFLELFGRMPEFAKSLLVQMAPQICEAHCRCAMAAAPVEARLAALLLRLHRQFQSGPIPFTRQELGQMAGTTVETTIRTLSEWAKQGYVEGSRGNLKVKDIEALEELAATE